MAGDRDLERRVDGLVRVAEDFAANYRPTGVVKIGVMNQTEAGKPSAEQDMPKTADKEKPKGAEPEIVVDWGLGDNALDGR